MDSIKATIKERVLAIDESLVDNEALDIVIGEVVDRVLIYTNRYQLIGTETLPIPTQLESSIARVVISLIKTIEADFESREVKSVSDLSQSITFGDEAQSYLASADDGKIFMSIKPMLDKFRIGTVVERD